MCLCLCLYLCLCCSVATKSVFPPNGDVPVDNRPKLQQQPRRKSLDAPAPVIPSRDELMEAKRKGVELSASQTEFFRMLDEKVEVSYGVMLFHTCYLSLLLIVPSVLGNHLEPTENMPSYRYSNENLMCIRLYLPIGR